MMITKKRTVTFNLTGLNANTTYYAYAMIQDYDDAISDVIKVSFTTAQADTLQSMTVSGIKAQSYTGKAICPKITLQKEMPPFTLPVKEIIPEPKQSNSKLQDQRLKTQKCL